MAATVQDGEAGMEVTEPATIPGRKIIVLYGSETGNAEDIAIELSQMTRRLHFTTVVDEMNNIKLAELIQYSLAIFVTSTAGQGDLPRNTEKFWANLRRTRLNNTNCLGALNFTIFGLGDSSYPNVNAAARKLRSRLIQLGASEFFRPGEGDERHDNGIDSVYLPWSEELKGYLLTNHPLPETLQPLSDEVQLPPRYFIDISPATESHTLDTMPPTKEDLKDFEKFKNFAAVRTHLERPRSKIAQIDAELLRLGTNAQVIARATEDWERENPRSFGSLDKDNVLTDHPEMYALDKPEPSDQTPQLPPSDLLNIPGSFTALVDGNHRVTPSSHWQDVRRISLTISLEGGDRKRTLFLPDAAGATVVIYPKNYPEDVQTLIDMMGWGFIADVPYNRTKSSLPKNFFPKEDKEVMTLRDMLTHNLDITAIPKRSFLKELIHYTKDPKEKERLLELTLQGGGEEFYDYTSRPRRTIIEVLRDFPGVKIPFKSAPNAFPVIRGREFSFANGGVNSMDDEGELLYVDILAALVEYKTIIRKPRQGLCSRYLKHLKPGTLLKVTINPPTSDTLRPVAHDKTPFERPLLAVATGTGIAPIRALVDDRISAKITAPILLFFGCRNKNADFYFEEDWEDPTVGKQANVRLIPAFSRDKKPREEAPVPELDEDGRRIPVPKPLYPERVDKLDLDHGKNYVQNQIKKHALEVGKFLSKSEVPPIICVCGNAGRMPITVREALEDALVTSKVVPTKEEARDWLKDKKNVTYWQETW